MLSRILVALPAGALLIFSLFENFSHNILFSCLLILFPFLSVLEYFKMVGDRVSRWSAIVGSIFTMLFMAAAILAPVGGSNFVLLLAVPLCALLFLFCGRIFSSDFEGAFEDIGLAFLPIYYIGFGFSSMYFLKTAPGIGGYLVLYSFVVVWLFDSFALFTGKLFGKHKMGLAASPNKSVEGTIGGLLFAVVGAIVFRLIFADVLGAVRFFSWPVFIPLSLVLAALVFIGDLAESVLKRSVGVKDSGALVPGHGGVLDVFDAQILVSPFLYVIIVLLGR